MRRIALFAASLVFFVTTVSCSSKSGQTGEPPDLELSAAEREAVLGLLLEMRPEAKPSWVKDAAGRFGGNPLVHIAADKTDWVERVISAGEVGIRFPWYENMLFLYDGSSLLTPEEAVESGLMTKEEYFEAGQWLVARGLAMEVTME